MYVYKIYLASEIFSLVPNLNAALKKLNGIQAGKLILLMIFPFIFIDNVICFIGFVIASSNNAINLMSAAPINTCLGEYMFSCANGKNNSLYKTILNNI